MSGDYGLCIKIGNGICENWYCVVYLVLGKNGNRYFLILLKMCWKNLKG